MANNSSLRKAVAFVAGLVFAGGLAISGMTQPGKVIGFLQIGEGWDPSLIFVMLGAIPVHALSYYLMKKRPTPLLDTQWHLPKNKKISKSLLIGSALFGVGWGLAGYCPGPALTSFGSGQAQGLIFTLALIAGMFLYKYSGAAKWNS